MRKRVFFSVMFFLLIQTLFYSCKKELLDTVTTVEIFMIDETGTIPTDEKHILSIYDESNPNDFRYSQYSTNNSVKFENVASGEYLAHALPIDRAKNNYTKVTVNKGDHLKVYFTYYQYGTITLGNSYSGYYTVPYYTWKSRVVNN